MVAVVMMVLVAVVVMHDGSSDNESCLHVRLTPAPYLDHSQGAQEVWVGLNSQR